MKKILSLANLAGLPIPKFLVPPEHKPKVAEDSLEMILFTENDVQEMEETDYVE